MEGHEDIEEVLSRLKAEDFKLTQQRRLIVQKLLSDEDNHPSAEEIYHMVRSEDPEVGLATVYRTLDLLQRLDIVHKVNFGDGKARYEMRGEQHQHHHLLCTECGLIHEVGEDLLGEVEEKLTARTGFRISDHDVKFYGLCPDCLCSEVQAEAQQ